MGYIEATALADHGKHNRCFWIRWFQRLHGYVSKKGVLAFGQNRWKRRVWKPLELWICNRLPQPRKLTHNGSELGAGLCLQLSTAARLSEYTLVGVGLPLAAFCTALLIVTTSASNTSVARRCPCSEATGPMSPGACSTQAHPVLPACLDLSTYTCLTEGLALTSAWCCFVVVSLSTTTSLASVMKVQPLLASLIADK